MSNNYTVFYDKDACQ